VWWKEWRLHYQKEAVWREALLSARAGDPVALTHMQLLSQAINENELNGAGTLIPISQVTLADLSSSSPKAGRLPWRQIRS